ncbi:MAG: acetate--CoA ligase family protein, partial [Actinomycetota bacterium]|nr:acetate--CoA ligase family protein [Actinomycetota bacterium]
LLRGAPLLRGARGGSPVDLAAVAALASRIGELLVDEGLELIESNPMLAGPDGAVAVDASVRRGAAARVVQPVSVDTGASCVT